MNMEHIKTQMIQDFRERTEHYNNMASEEILLAYNSDSAEIALLHQDKAAYAVTMTQLYQTMAKFPETTETILKSFAVEVVQKKKSKYLGMTFGDWTCTKTEVAYVQPSFKQKKVNGESVRSKCPGHRQYVYTFEKFTPDRQVLKTIKLNAGQAKRVLRGERTVEDYINKNK